jgi:uncharacterized protein YecE (DUF72 family)
MLALHVGPCGICMRQAEFFRTFRLVELQQTFYRPPRVATAERWRRDAGAGFEFTLKAFQAITHAGTSSTFRRSGLSEAERRECGSFGETAVVRAAWETTRRLADVLEAPFVIFQCPRSFEPTGDNVNRMRRFFGWADRGRHRFGWEPRGEAWTPDLVGSLCRELDLVHVVDPFHAESTHGSPRYFRLHGEITEKRINYHYRYTDEQLEWLKGRCGAAETYCLFNNVPVCDETRRFLRLLQTG